MVDADGTGTHTVVAEFSSYSACNASITFKAPTPCVPDLGSVTGDICNNLNPGEVGGTAWEDWNYNGVQDETPLIGVAGIAVIIIDCEGMILGTTYTDARGNWSFDMSGAVFCDGCNDVRVEYSLPETISCWAKPTKAGMDNGTTVQFIGEGDCANMGLINLTDYCTAFVETQNQAQAQNSSIDFLTCYDNPDPSTSSGLTFDGVDDYATLGDLALFDFGAAQDFTIELRIKSGYPSGDPSIISDKDWSDGDNTGFIIHTDGSGEHWEVNISDGTNRLDVFGGNIADGDWHLISVSFDRDGNMTLFQDGVSCGSTDISIIGNIHSGLPLNIGQDGTGTYDDFFTGTVDEVKIWDVALDAATIQSRVCDEIVNPASEANLIGYWKLNENSGMISADETANGNNLNIIGATWEVDSSTPMACNGTKYIVQNCFGTVISIDKSLLAEPNVGYILHGAFSPSSGSAPVCMIFTNEVGEIQPSEWVFCLDQTLPTGIESTLFANKFDYGVDATETELSSLQSAQVAWILANWEAEGYSLPDDARDINTAVWTITDPGSYTCDPGDDWYTLCNGAMTNVPSVPVQPSLVLALSAGENSIETPGNSIQYDLTSDNLSLELSVSDAGAMPTVCGGVGGSIVDNGNGTGTLTLNSAGTVNLCLTRNTETLVELKVTDPSVLSDGMDMQTFRHQPYDTYQDYARLSSPTSPTEIELAKWLDIPLEIGNYVWIDENLDGLQDACEPAVPNLLVRLFDENGVLLASTTTNADGAYYFQANGSGDGATWENPDAIADTDDDALQPNTKYYIVFGEDGDFDNTNGQITLDGTSYNITQLNAPGGANTSDQIDSDVDVNSLTTTIGAMPANLLNICYTTGDVGCTDHTLDMGLSLLDPAGFFYCVETGEIISGGSITVVPPAGGAVFNFDNGSDGSYSFDVSGDGTYTIAVTPPPGYAFDNSTQQGSPFDPTGMMPPVNIGSGSTDGIALDDFTAGANPFYNQITFEAGDPDVFLNNIALTGCSTTGCNEACLVFRDNFNNTNGNESYDNQDGNVNWNGLWIENGDDGDPSSGDVQLDNGELRFDNDDATPPSVARALSITGATSAKLVVDFFLDRDPDAPYDGTDLFDIQISGDGGMSFTTLMTISGADYPDAHTGGANGQVLSFDITSFLDNGMVVRLGIQSGFADADEFIYIDHVAVIACYLGVDITTIVGSVNCTGSNGQGSLTVVGYNGVPPYEYSIDGGTTYQSENLFENLLPNSYTIMVRDNNGVTCTTTGTVPVLTEPLASSTCVVSVSGATAIQNDYVIDFTEDTPLIMGGDRTTSASVTGNVLNAVDNSDAGFDYYIQADVSGGPNGFSSVGFPLTESQLLASVHNNNDPSVNTTAGYLRFSLEGTNSSLDPRGYYRDPTSQMLLNMTLENGSCFENVSFTLGDLDYNFINTDPDSDDFQEGEPNNYNQRQSYIDRVRILSGAGTNDYSSSGSNVNIFGDIGIAAYTDVNGNNYPDLAEDGRLSTDDPAGYFTIQNNITPLSSLSWVYDDPGFGIEGDVDRLHDFDSGNQLHTLQGPITFSQTCYEFCEGNSVDLDACITLTNVIWYNSADVQIGTGSSTTINAATNGMADNIETFYYTGEDANGCLVKSCPVLLKMNDKVAVGNLVYMDTNEDGDFDSGTDMTLDGVVVELYTASATIGVDPALDMTTTSGGGFYLFDNLEPGMYVVHIPSSNFAEGQPLAGKRSSDGEGIDNGIDDDMDENGQNTFVNGGVSSGIIDLQPNDEPEDEDGQGTYSGLLDDASVNLTVDFSFEERVAVGNYVYMDVDDDGDYDDGVDMALDGVTVELYAASATIGTDPALDMTTTSGGGFYLFDNLQPGMYVVHIPSSNFADGQPLAGKRSSDGEGGDVGIDDDVDENGQNTFVNGGVSSSIIDLQPNDEPEDETGEGTYAGTLDDDNVNLTVDFSFEERVAIGNLVFMDVNGDGDFDSGIDMPVDGVTVELYAASATIGTDPALDMTTTSGGGFYLFDNLEPGMYVVHIPSGNFAEGQPLANKSSSEPEGVDDGIDDNAGENGQNIPVNGGISSGVIDLQPSDEPEDETGQGIYPGTLDDDNVNLGVDFSFHSLDFGDVPDDPNNPSDLPTLIASDGARHIVPETPVVFLGSTVDPESEGQPNGTANGDDNNGDDEDGVVFENLLGEPQMVVTCEMTTIVVTASTNGFLNVWADYNSDGDWDEMNEQIFDDVPLMVGQNELTFTAPCPANVTTESFLRFRFSTQAGLEPTGLAMDGEVEDYAPPVKGLDFGDLPDGPYPTLFANDPARHVVPPVTQDMYLGAGVDDEDEGAQSPMADGDGADEDGVRLTTPLIPGEMACVEVITTVPMGETAYLQGWIDFNTDGSLLTAGDQIITNEAFTDASNGMTTEVCFEVPATATFETGMAFMRFRFGPEQGLQPTGLSMNGEVEDYKYNLAKVGNLVWQDNNYDGIQGPAAEEMGINDMTVLLTWAGPDASLDDDTDNRIYSLQTANVGGKDGIYYFCGLIDGNYRLEVVTDRFLTQLGMGTELTDSNDDQGTDFSISIPNLREDENGTSDMPGMINGFANNQDDLSFDFGYAGFDYGDLPNTFSTLDEDDGPKHIATPNKFLGSCIDIDLDGQPDFYAGFDGLAGDDVAPGLASFPQGAECSDDEDGIVLLTSMVPGSEACIQVSSTLPIDEDGVLNGWIDFNGNDLFDTGEQLVFSTQNGEAIAGGPTTEGPLPMGAGQVTELCFMVPETATFEGIETHMRFRMSCEGGLDYSGNLPNEDFPFGEVEDYYQPLAEIGDFVWFDTRNNGIQELLEPPIIGATVSLYLCDAGVKGEEVGVAQITDEEGFYEFIGLLPDQEYCVQFDVTTATNYDLQPGDYEWAQQGALGGITADGDSDVNDLGCSPSVPLAPLERNEGIDAGIEGPCKTPEVEVVNVMTDMITITWDPRMDETLGHFFNLKVLGCSSLGGVLDLGDVYEVEGLDADQAPAWPGFDLAEPKTLYYDQADDRFYYIVDGLSPCACYDVQVSQICDDWIDLGNLGPFGSQEDIKTFESDPACSANPTNVDDTCTLECEGSVDLTITGGPCFGDRYVQIDWERGAESDHVVYQTDDELFTLDNLCAGDYSVTVTICDEGEATTDTEAGSVSGNCKSTSCDFTITGEDALAPVFEIGFEDDANGPDETSNENSEPDAENTLALGTITLPEAGCVADLDFFIDFINDNCRVEDIEVGIEIIQGDATAELIPNDDNPGEYIILVHAGPGSGILKVYARDADNTSYAFASWTIEGLATPHLITPGSATFSIPECASSTTVYFDIQGEACEPVYLWVESEDLGIPAQIGDPGNIRSFLVEQVQVGEYEVRAYADTDISDVSDAVSQTFTVRVIAGGQDDGPIIIGPGQIMKTIAICEESIDASFDIFVVDDCNEGAVIEQVSAVDGADNPVSVSGDAPSFSLSDLSEGTYTVTASFTGAADYTFEIIVMKAGANRPAVILAASENVTIPQCEEDDLVYYTFQVMDDCEAIDLDNVSIDGGFIITDRAHQDGNTKVGVFTAQADLGFGVHDVTITYGAISSAIIIAVNGQANATPVVTLPGNSTYTILACESEVAATIGITISDDCDNFEATAANANFSFRGASIDPDFTNPDGNSAYYEFNVVLSAADDGAEFAVEYTDGANQTVLQSILLVVNSQADEIAPVIVYPAVSIEVELEACDPNPAVVTYEVSATDNCDGELEVSVSVSPTPISNTNVEGNRYELVAQPGTYTVVLRSTDAAGNTREEDFLVEVSRPSQIPSNLGCNDEINVTLNGDCEVLIVADMVLEGNLGCLTNDDFEIVVIDRNPDNGPIVDGCGDFTYEIRLKEGRDGGDFTTCWGIIHADDKEAPIIECPADTDQASLTEQANFIPGSLDVGDPQLNLANHTCFFEVFNPASGDHYYDTYTFEVTQDDVYTFLLGADFDATSAIYQGRFNAASPCENIIGQNDDLITGTSVFAGPVQRLALPLRAGETYVLFTSSNGANVTGNYQWAVYADGDGQIEGLRLDPINLTLDLICNDIDQILLSTPTTYVVNRDGFTIPGTMSDELQRKLGYTGRPTISDNCGEVLVRVTDEVAERGNCGEVVITRTFYLEDKYNSDCSGSPNTAFCQQKITIRKASLGDLFFPPLTAFVECDEEYPTLDNGNPSPELTGYPFLRTAFAFEDLKEEYCNLGASFEDRPSVEVCQGTYKFFREWSMFDWCNPTASLTYLQLIKVGDYTAPQVDCPQEDYDWDGEYDLLTYSTGPFDCTGAFEVPLPTVSDNCSADLVIFTEIVTDVLVDVLDQYGQVIGQESRTIIVRNIGPNDSRYVSGIPYGQHRFRYIVTDACGNETITECDFQVVDKIEPTAICDDELNVSIGGQSLARVYAADIDEGSYDNCQLDRIKVRRTVDNILDLGCIDHFDYNDNGVVLNDEVTQATVEINQTKWVTPWLDYVDFLCCDVGEQVTVELGVWDVYGNFNVCWLVTSPEDKALPTCYAPHDVTIDCDDLPYDFDPMDLEQLSTLFDGVDGGGNTLPRGEDNCAIDSISSSVVSNLDDCGFGSLIRTFKVYDVNGNASVNTCRQVIRINEVHNYEILFPKDAEANCGEPDVDTLRYNEIGCDLLAVSKDTQRFVASGDECYKMLITYSVINWCEYNGQAPPVIIGRDEDCDDNEAGYKDEPAGIWVLVRPDGTTYLDRDTDESNDNPSRFETCDYPATQGHWTNSNVQSRLRSNGYWQYTQHIRVYDDEAPQLNYQATDPFCSEDNETCDAAVSVPFSITEVCTPNDLEIKIFLDVNADGIIDGQLNNAEVLIETTRDGITRNFTINGTYPIGNHAFEVHVLDGCRQSDAAVIPFSVKDCKAPSPICISVLAVELMPADLDGDGAFNEGAMAVWATDFVNSPITDCSEPIKISINRVGAPANIEQGSLQVTCEDAPGTVSAEVHAWDAAGNHDYCEVFIDVQDNQGLCGATGAGVIAGLVLTEEDVAIEGAAVNLSGQQSGDQTTGLSGAYRFNNLALNYDYSVAPQLDRDWINGVTTFDLVLITKHILGVRRLDSPYKMIAADANNSKSVTTLDIIKLRKLILGVDTHLDENTSWRFIKADYNFPDHSNPWSEFFPEVYSINDLEGQFDRADFVGVKIGDVNGSVRANSRIGDDRSMEGVFSFELQEQAFQAGETVSVSFSAKDFDQIQGYQATLTFDQDKLEYQDLKEGTVKVQHFGRSYLEQGMITTSWNESTINNQRSTNKEEGEAILFSLIFQAKQSGTLSEVLGISSKITQAESYHQNGELQEVVLNFNNGITTKVGFELYQNRPNPFHSATIISFHLPKASKTRITVHDVSGRVVRIFQGDHTKGYNEVRVEGKDLATNGLLYYTLEAGEYKATRRMMVLD